MKAKETPRENSTIQKGAKFFFNETRDRAVTLLLPGEESFELFGDDAVQHAFFGMTRGVFNRRCQHTPASMQELSQLK